MGSVCVWLKSPNNSSHSSRNSLETENGRKPRIARISQSDKNVMLAGAVVASIIPFMRVRSDFDDEVTRIMGEAFDAACEALHDTGQPTVVHEVMAKRIIAAAKTGERDPFRLRDIAIAAAGKTARLKGAD